MRPALFIAVGVRRVARAAKAGRACGSGARRPSPRRALRPHEGLVVEAGAEEGREQAVERADVEAERRPAVLAVGHRARRGAPRMVARVLGSCARRCPTVDQRIGLGGARGEHAARPMIFEAAAHRVAGRWRGAPRRACRPREPCKALPSKVKAQRARSVDAAARGQTRRLMACSVSALGRVTAMASISWVARIARHHQPAPAACCSGASARRWAPRGLSRRIDVVEPAPAVGICSAGPASQRRAP